MGQRLGANSAGGADPPEDTGTASLEPGSYSAAPTPAAENPVFSLASSGPLRIEETSMCPTEGDQNCPNFKTESPGCWRPLSPG